MYLDLEADGQINKNTLLTHGYNYDNQVNNLKNNDRVYLIHFEDMSNVFIIKDVNLLNEVIKSTVQDECKLFHQYIYGTIFFIMFHTNEHLIE